MLWERVQSALIASMHTTSMPLHSMDGMPRFHCSPLLQQLSHTLLLLDDITAGWWYDWAATRLTSAHSAALAANSFSSDHQLTLLSRTTCLHVCSICQADCFLQWPEHGRAAWWQKADLAIVAVKADWLPTTLERARQLTREGGTILCLHNGHQLEVLERFSGAASTCLQSMYSAAVPTAPSVMREDLALVMCL